MAFMTPDIYKGKYAIIDRADGGTDFIPAGYVEDVAKDGDIIDYAEGYLGRLSASGYMDRTDWAPIDDATDDDDALRRFCDGEDICPHCYEQCWDDETSECEGRTV